MKTLGVFLCMLVLVSNLAIYFAAWNHDLALIVVTFILAVSFQVLSKFAIEESK